MEKKKFSAELKKLDGKDSLCLFLESEELQIDLNSDDQTNLRKVFFKIINELFEGEFEFVLENETYEKQLFLEIAQDYIKKLNDEIANIYQQLPKELKAEEKSPTSNQK